MTYIMQRSKESHLILPVRPQVCGFFKLTAIRPDGRRRPLTDWFPNLITDGGLNRLASGDWMRHCHVGSGSATPAVTDTALQTFVASTSQTQSVSDSAQASAPYYMSRSITFRFPTGEAEGNLSEVGVGWEGASVGPLFSRALIVDGGGSPTTITVLADEVLDVVYQLRLVPPTADESYNVVDDGPAGTAHAIVLRAANVTSFSGNGWWFGTTAQYFGQSVALMSGLETNFPGVKNGSLGGVTTIPSGTNSEASSVSNEAYVNNSLEREASAFWDLDRGNVSGGITAGQFNFRSAGAYQFSVDPAIPKDNTKVLTLGFKVEWSRAT